MTEDIQKKLMDTFEVEEVKADISIFPPPFLGIMSERNSVGEYIAQTDKPKETAYRAQEWELDDWAIHILELVTSHIKDIPANLSNPKK